MNCSKCGENIETGFGKEDLINMINGVEPGQHLINHPLIGYYCHYWDNGGGWSWNNWQLDLLSEEQLIKLYHTIKNGEPLTPEVDIIKLGLHGSLSNMANKIKELLSYVISGYNLSLGNVTTLYFDENGRDNVFMVTKIKRSLDGSLPTIEVEQVKWKS